MELESVGKMILALGIGLVILGGAFLLFSRVPGLNHIGRLPGDIRIQRGNFTCFAPILSMCLLSLILTVVLNVVARIFAK